MSTYTFWRDTNILPIAGCVWDMIGFGKNKKKKTTSKVHEKIIQVKFLNLASMFIIWPSNCSLFTAFPKRPQQSAPTHLPRALHGWLPQPVPVSLLLSSLCPLLPNDLKPTCALCTPFLVRPPLAPLRGFILPWYPLCEMPAPLTLHLPYRAMPIGVIKRCTARSLSFFTPSLYCIMSFKKKQDSYFLLAMSIEMSFDILE